MPRKKRKHAREIESTLPVAPPPPKCRISTNTFRLATMSIFSAFCFWFLAFPNRDFLAFVPQQMLFLDTAAFFWQHTTYPGGLLEYITRFFSQFCYYPVLGAGILTFLLVVLQILAAHFFRLRLSLLVLTYIPSVLLLFHATQCGYLVFSFQPLDFLFGFPIASIAVLLFTVQYKNFKRHICRFIYYTVGILCLYYMCGFFGLLAILLCAAVTPQWKQTTAMCLVAAAIPILFVLSVVSTGSEYRVTLYLLISQFDINGGFNFTCFAFIGLFFVLSCFHLFRGMRNTDKNSRQLLTIPVVALNMAALIGGAAAIVSVSQHNAEFQTTLRLWRYLEEEDWERILQDKYDDDAPNPLIVRIRNLAIFKLNRHTDQMFTYPQVSKKVLSLETFADKLDCEARIVYEYGEINAANMIAMNLMSPSMKNYKPHTVITLALCAMQNDEIGLAKKYLILLSHSPLHKRWAKDRLQYVSDKTLLDASLANSIDEHLAAVHSIMPKNMRAAFIPNMPLGSLYIQSILNRGYASSPESIRQLRLMILLQMNRPQEFLRDFEIWYKNRPNVNDKLPVHFQEAVLILAQYPLRTVPQHEFSPDILARYQKLVAFINSRSRTDTSALREQFGDTYWYYALLRQNNPQR